ncbi:hypothetical protein QJS10_CPB14g01624 [Acorus calamus]|uniref:BED-type domain-containing protein n=1 Tax=Acorus calamus TaxID=4465 RepID=A0AAV9DE38_ACOCL|nr:hypothetical protein QJS10_CPB14g01624 [Acorus calamus]
MAGGAAASSSSPATQFEVVPLSAQKHDPAWQHCQMMRRPGDNRHHRVHLRCTYCHKLFSGGGIHRIKEHLPPAPARPPTSALPCSAAWTASSSARTRSSSSQKRFRSSNQSMTPTTTTTGVPFCAADSHSFRAMIKAVASAVPGLAPPVCRDLRGRVLKDAVDEARDVVERHRGVWARTGCSIMVDECVAESGRTMVNVLVYCAEGTLFLKSANSSHVVAADALCELLKQAVEEVGAQNVVQVITNGADAYVEAGRRIAEDYPTVFWTTCAFRCVNSMLEDMLKLDSIGTIVEHAKTVTGFVYGRPRILNLTRRYTAGKDLVRPSVSRAATCFTTLKRMVGLRENLEAMVVSREWMDCPCSKSPAGVAFFNTVSSVAFWSSCATVAHLSNPLVRVLKAAESLETPAMGHIYAGLHRAREAIKKELKTEKDYAACCDIIDWRWERQLKIPLHTAGLFLNPRHFYALKEDAHKEFTSGMFDCVERRMVVNVWERLPEPEAIGDADTQPDLQRTRMRTRRYSEKTGDFFGDDEDRRWSVVDELMASDASSPCTEDEMEGFGIGFEDDGVDSNENED